MGMSAAELAPVERKKTQSFVGRDPPGSVHRPPPSRTSQT